MQLTQVRRFERLDLTPRVSPYERVMNIKHAARNPLHETNAPEFGSINTTGEGHRNPVISSPLNRCVCVQKSCVVEYEKEEERQMWDPFGPVDN